MTKQLQNITINGRTYTPATTFKNMVNYILEWFDDEAFRRQNWFLTYQKVL